MMPQGKENAVMVLGSDRSVPEIPLRGFGTFQVDSQPSSSGTVKQAVLAALQTGYRHIDTASAYGDGQVEKEVGLAVRASGIPREEIFIVTKLSNNFHKPEDVQLALQTSLSNLRLKYVDLYLMHNAYAYVSDDQHKTVRRPDGSGKPLIDIPISKGYPDTFKAMESLVASGLTKSIGVSNFNMLKLKRLIKESGIVPAANQIEMNPYFPQPELVKFCQSYNIRVIAHCPLGGAVAAQVTGRKGNGPLQDHLINYIAVNHQKTAAQVILAWIIGQDICVVPKSNDVKRIQENFDVCFRLSAAEQDLISSITNRTQPAQRNMVSADHIGFDTFDEDFDQPL
ncbi:MAG: hypothetical protein M1836_006455 [Candelina mexicana]|nr:MAG: hypothetical protein M1836_006455 [Candelina mexicana]